MSYLERVIVLVDMDCFYCQVEENVDSKLRGKPIAVVQYNAWRGGGIIAVNYPARDCGVTRHMRGNEAKEKCPSIQLVRVPNVRGKADLTKYREAGKKVAEVLQSFTTLLERASVDEAYLDITESVINRMKYVERIHPDQLKNTHVVDYDNVDSFLNSIYSNELMNESNIKLAWGGVIAEEIRAAVLESTGYKCSAGVAHNKILAKLVAGLHKPNQQTVLPHAGVPVLFEDLPVRKIRSLGGKFGNHISEKLGIQNMGELCKYSEKELAKHFDEKTASWLYNIARGIDNDPVTVRLVSKSIGCCKKFPGRTALTNHDAVKHWLNELSIEISERLEKDLEENNRKAKQMVVNFANEVNRKDLSGSRSHPLNSYDANRIMLDAYEVIKKNCMRADNSFCIKFLGISVGKFEDVKNVNSVASFFNRSQKDFDNENNSGENYTKSSVTNFNRDTRNTNEMDTVSNCGNDGENHLNADVGNNVGRKGGSDRNNAKEKNRNSIASFFMNYTNQLKTNRSDNERSSSNECNAINSVATTSENILERAMQSIENIVPNNSNPQTIDLIDHGHNNIQNNDTNSVQNGKSSGFTSTSDLCKNNDYIESDYSQKNSDQNHHTSNKFSHKNDNNGFINNQNTPIIDDFIYKTCDNDSAESNINDSIPKSCSDGNTSAFIEENNDESNDSITEELQQSSNIHNTSSFFNKYMEKLQIPVERNFNTSLGLDHEDFDTGIDEILNDEIESSQKELDRISRNSITCHDEDVSKGIVIPTDSPEFESFNHNQEVPNEINPSITNEIFNDGCELCPECNKRIPQPEFISHMDYHFALKIVRDEADLYRPVKIEKIANPKPNLKRKSSNPDKCMKLTSFLVPRNEDDGDVPKEVCSECNKSVPIEDLASHVDYHLAKRIHLELNNFNTSDGKVNVKKCDNKPKIKKYDNKSSGKVNGKKDNGCSIATFFKPV